MIPETEIFVMSFLVLGGVIMFLPLVLLGKIAAIGLLKSIGAFILIILASTLFYLIATNVALVEILTLKTNSIILPKRIFSVSYIIIVVFIIMLPIALLRNKFTNENKKT